MSENVSYNVEMIPYVCCVCGTLFSITKQLYDLREHDSKNFSCPNGHEQHFRKKDENNIEYWKKAYIRLKQQNNTLIENNNKLAAKCEQLEFKLSQIGAK